MQVRGFGGSLLEGPEYGGWGDLALYPHFIPLLRVV